MLSLSLRNWARSHTKEISEIDQQINGYKKESEKLTVNISSLNNEILNLENEKPDLSNKISKINEELVGYSNVKAELSVLTAEQKAEVENIITKNNDSSKIIEITSKQISKISSSTGFNITNNWKIEFIKVIVKIVNKI